MKSETITVQQLFQDRRQYRVPFYQRAYVWNKDDQWERLWSDIQDKANLRLLAADTQAPHFLGAVVLEPQPRRGLLGVETLHIIDGQQRLTTLQYALAALTLALRTERATALVSLIDACLRNSNADTMERRDTEVFKVWPTFRDRQQYQAAMTASNLDELRACFPASFTQAGALRKIGVDHPPALEAIWYFHERLTSWLDEGELNERPARVEAVAEATLRDLRLVSISLGEDDDAQVIFETLNGHGAELHATDLIRNFIFMQADREGSEAENLYDTLWSPFETAFWTEEQRRGRLKRPRLEWFVQTALQAELGNNVDIGRLYVGYKEFATGRKTQVTATDQLRSLDRYSDGYRQLVTGNGSEPIARFGRRTEIWEASTTHALALLIAKSGCAVEEQKGMYDDVASYLVRRAICGLTTKNYNRVFVQLLKKLPAIARTSLRAALRELEGDASRWPEDDEFRKSWLEAEIHPGRLDAARTKALLLEIEAAMRSHRTEEPVLSGNAQLDVDHILPLNWLAHWPLADGTHAEASEIEDARHASYTDQPLTSRLEAIRRREATKARLGNLTLLHYGVNRGLQNHAFSKKRERMFAESNLHLNRKLMQAELWHEDAIDERGRQLFEIGRGIWRGPSQ
jgi:hypothetical protein